MWRKGSLRQELSPEEAWNPQHVNVGELEARIQYKGRMYALLEGMLLFCFFFFFFLVVLF